MHSAVVRNVAVAVEEVDFEFFDESGEVGRVGVRAVIRRGRSHLACGIGVSAVVAVFVAGEVNHRAVWVRRFVNRTRDGNTADGVVDKVVDEVTSENDFFEEDIAVVDGNACREFGLATVTARTCVFPRVVYVEVSIEFVRVVTATPSLDRSAERKIRVRGVVVRHDFGFVTQRPTATPAGVNSPNLSVDIDTECGIEVVEHVVDERSESRSRGVSQTAVAVADFGYHIRDVELALAEFDAEVFDFESKHGADAVEDRRYAEFLDAGT